VSAGPTLHAFPDVGCGAATCSPWWTAPVDAGATSAPIVAGGVVYMGADGAVAAYVPPPPPEGPNASDRGRVTIDTPARGCLGPNLL
jgi:hypothetical protein